ncbi:MAG: AMP-binding protein [Archangium sp.]|nr:AMP-binding protein [Archangium sp.]
MNLPPHLEAAAQAWRATFRTGPKRLALYFDDRQAFTAALFAAWAERKQVVLPGDVLPATLKALSSHVDAWVGDFPAKLTLKPGAAMSEPWVDPDREAEGLVVFTSGTTGVPSAIPKRLRQLFDEVKTLEATFGHRVGADAKLFSTVSHQHIYGLLFSVLWPIATGRTLTARRLEYPEELEQELGLGPCVLISSPAHLKRLPDVAPWKTQLRAVFSSGGPLPEEGAARAKAVLGHQPIEVFGSSETGGIAWRQGTQSTWSTLSGVEIRRSAEGMLELRSPHLADPAWLTTADRIELAGDTFKLLGRSDRIAKIEEKRVSLELIERTACSTGLVSEAKAVVIEGARVTLGLVVVLTGQGRALERKDLVDQLKAALEVAVERVALPRRFRVVDALPVNAQGKVTEAALVSLFIEGPCLPLPEGERGGDRANQPTIPPGAIGSAHVAGTDPKWLERTPTHAVLSMTISPSLRVLDGHFPGTPVVPGVAQLDWAVGWGREAFGFTGRFTRLEVLKFQALMLPGHQVKLVLDWNAERSTLTFKFTSETASYSSGRVVFS